MSAMAATSSGRRPKSSNPPDIAIRPLIPGTFPSVPMYKHHHSVVFSQQVLSICCYTVITCENVR